MDSLWEPLRLPNVLTSRCNIQLVSPGENVIWVKMVDFSTILFLFLPPIPSSLYHCEVRCWSRNGRRNCNKPDYVLGAAIPFCLVFKLLDHWYITGELKGYQKREICFLIQSAPRNYTILSDNLYYNYCLIVSTIILHERILEYISLYNDLNASLPWNTFRE